LRRADEFALLDKLAQNFDQTLITHLKAGADAFGGEGLGRLGQQGEDFSSRGSRGEDAAAGIVEASFR
jgi:hypothetical protein